MIYGAAVGWAFVKAFWRIFRRLNVALRAGDGRIIGWAHGDGTLDDTDNLQRAIDRTATTLYIPAGQFAVRPLVVGGTLLSGAGHDATTLSASDEEPTP